MRHVGAVVDGVAAVQFLGVAGGLDTNAAFLDSQKFARAFEMRRAAQRAALTKLNFIELDIFLEMQRRKGGKSGKRPPGWDWPDCVRPGLAWNG